MYWFGYISRVSLKYIIKSTSFNAITLNSLKGPLLSFLLFFLHLYLSNKPEYRRIMNNAQTNIEVNTVERLYSNYLPLSAFFRKYR